MREKIQRFWVNLLLKVDGKINQWLNKKRGLKPIIDAGDDSVINFFLMILKKVINRSLMGAEYSVVSDSALSEPLQELCENLQDNIYSIVGNMLGNNVHAECWVVPSFITVGGQQKLIHSYIGGEKVCITQTKEDGQISECYMIINATVRKDKTYFLCRKHNLDDNGNLTISYFVADESAKEINADIPEWNSTTDTEITYYGVNNIGFGRYKSPVIAYGNDTVYGVPLNYGCGLIEKQLNDAVKYIEDELKLSEKRLFAEFRVVRKDLNEKGYTIDEKIFPIKLNGESAKDMITEYCPAIRGTEFESHLTSLLERYQALMGVRDIITHNNTTNGATATEVKILNADNISLEQSIKKAIRKGNIETLEADAMYLGIARDLWEYDEEYGDIYADEQQTLKNYLDLYNAGALELKDLVKYWFPTYSDEQIEEKMLAINEEKANNSQKSIEELLNI